MSSKTCSACNEIKPLDKFFAQRSTKDGKQTFCKKCNKLKYAEKKSSSEYLLSQHDKHLQRKYGINLDTYEDMYVKSGGKCYICNSVDPGQQRKHFCVDHDHKDGSIRGLLCYSCNSGLGFLKDDTDLLNKAINYLEKHKLRVQHG